MIKLSKTLSLLLLCVSVLEGQTGEGVFTIEEAVAYAIEHSSDVQQQRLEIADADAQIKEYWAIGLPTLDANVDYSHYFEIPTQIIPDFITPTIDNRLLGYEVQTERVGVLDNPNKFLPLPFDGGIPARFGTENIFTYGAELNALLFDGSFLVGLNAQRMYKELVAAEMEQTLRDVEVNVRKAYLSALVSQENLQIIERNIENISRLLYETEETYKAGFVEQLDVDRLRLSHRTLEADRENLLRLIDINKNLLKFHMNYPIEQPIELEGELESMLVEALNGLDTLYNYEDRIEYRLLQKGQELNKINIKRLKAGYLPTLKGFASYSRSQQNDKLFTENAEWYPSSIAGLTLEVPLFDGNDKSARIQRARISMDQNQLRMETFERSMELQVSNARATYMNARIDVTNRDQTLGLAQKIYDTTLIKYREGVGSSLEVIQSEQDLFAAQADYINALYDLINARIELKKALGEI